jgi:hypothetical protein
VACWRGHRRRGTCADGFQANPSLHVIDVSHIEEFGQNRRAPDGATVLFEGDDPRDGPMLRYTIVNRMERRPG